MNGEAQELTNERDTAQLEVQRRDETIWQLRDLYLRQDRKSQDELQDLRNQNQDLRNQNQQQQQPAAVIDNASLDALFSSLETKVSDDNSVPDIASRAKSLLAAIHAKSGHVLVQFKVEDGVTAKQVTDLLVRVLSIDYVLVDNNQAKLSDADRVTVKGGTYQVQDDSDSDRPLKRRRLEE